MLGNPPRTIVPPSEGLSFFSDLVSGVVGGLFGGKEEKKEKAPPPPPPPPPGPNVGLWALGLGGFAILVFILRGPRA